MEQVVEQVEPDQAEPDQAAGYPTAVVVRFGGSRYAVAMASVAEVVPVPPTSRVPGCPRWLSGVVNWRGRVLAVVDPRSLLGAETIPLPSSSRLLVLSVDGVEAGMVVEAVAGLLEAGETDPAPAPATASASASAMVLGVVADGHGPVSLLDARAVLALRSDLPSAR